MRRDQGARRQISPDLILHQVSEISPPQALILLYSLMAGNTTASYCPGEAAHVVGQIGEDAVYARVLYDHRFPSMLVKIAHTSTKFTWLG